MNLMQRFVFRSSIAVLLSLFIMLLVPERALAKNIVIEPAYQTVDLNKGETVEAEITLKNNTDKAITFNLFTLNFS